jgi:hypothetical protein
MNYQHFSRNKIMKEDTKNNQQVVTLIIAALLGGLLSWSIFNMYAKQSDANNEYKTAITSLSHDLDATNMQLESIIEEQVKSCRTRGLNVFITKPFQVQESIGIETTISIKIKYLNWQIELTLALSRMLNSTNPSPNPSPSPKPRPGSIGKVGQVGDTMFGDTVLPQGVTIR